MLDSGAMGMWYIDRNFAAKMGFELMKLDRGVRVKTIDGTDCGTGLVEYYIRGKVHFDEFYEDMELLVIDSPRYQVIFGHAWFLTYNPLIDWQEGTVQFGKDLITILRHGIPVCSTEGIPQRQDTVKKVKFSNEVSVRGCSNYIRSLDLEELGIPSDIPTGTADFEFSDTIPLPSDMQESIYLSVNGLLELEEAEEEWLIGFVDQYDVVEDEPDSKSQPKELLETFKDVFSTTEFPKLPPNRVGNDLDIELEDGKTAPFGPIYSQY
jgi:hypothetical protein